MEFTHQDAAILERIMLWRRDVRHFRPDPVPEDVLARLRAAMDHAPSVGNARPWRVIRVEDPALRAAVRAEFTRCNDNAAASYEGEQAQAYGKLKLAGLDAAPVQLAVFTETDPEAGHRLGRATMELTLQQSTAMAIFALWLAARAENLGLGAVSILEPSVIERLFAVPAHWEFAGYLCLGHPAFMDDTPLLHRADWQQNAPTLWETR
ncbi:MULTISPECIES: 5,6-dimethylbenzimidazole synthase [unclassified Acidocella]|uniref:5,6-dimethylbenzimidazole synthase n=1 Tax=unclassified Acidocella TaxID=2648610 RepID=UPI000344DAC7|nr:MULTISPECIES: 5,6-dimethylbenzimidazole synthase [unclassified Acidocella]WBO59382.1 5,6-dimethylbenzimidazole synthase [Acidocella sp. MX-AZ03]